MESIYRKLTHRTYAFLLAVGMCAVASKLLYLAGFLLPNLELVVPSLVVLGSVSLPFAPSRRAAWFTRYFGLLPLGGVFIVDLLCWGPNRIYLFTWSGFLFCWALAYLNRLSVFDRLSHLLWRTTLTAAAAIILFDVWTGLIGFPLLTGVSFTAALLGQIPFTLRHLLSLGFVPPLLLLGKLLVRVPVPVAVPLTQKTGQEVRTRER